MKFIKNPSFIFLVIVFILARSVTVFAATDPTASVQATVSGSANSVTVSGVITSNKIQYLSLEVLFSENQNFSQNKGEVIIDEWVKANTPVAFRVSVSGLDPAKNYFWKIVDSDTGSYLYKSGTLNANFTPTPTTGTSSTTGGTGTSSTTGSTTGTPPPPTGTITVNNATVTSDGTNLKVSGSVVSTANRSATLRVKYGTSANTMTATAAGNFFTGSLVANQPRTVSNFLISNGIQAGTTYYVQIYDANDSNKVFTGPLNVTTSGGTTAGGSGGTSAGGSGGTTAGGSGGTSAGGSGGTTAGGSGGTSAGGSGGDTTLENPLQVNSLWDFIEAVLGWVVKIGAVLVGVFFVISGFKFVAAQGNEEKLSEAKRGFVYTVIGAVLLLGAWTLATIISSTVAEIAR